MTEEIYEYFIGKYKNTSVRVVPGHWPDFKSKEEVDKWLSDLEKMRTFLFDKSGKNLPLDDDDDF